MSHFILISLFLLLNSVVFGQQEQKNQIFVQAGAGICFRDGFEPLSQQFGGGYYIKEGVSFGAKIWNLKDKTYAKTASYYSAIDILNVALDISYRPLKNKILSPAIQATFGLPVYSNANGKFVVPDNYYIVPEHPDNPDAPSIYIADIFEKSVYNYSLKLFADFKIKRFGIQFGPTLNKYKMNFTDLYVSNDVNGIPQVSTLGNGNLYLTSIGIELNLLYYF